MIIDSSAILAILLQETDHDTYLRAIAFTHPRRMSVANWLETTMVIDSRASPGTVARFEAFMDDAQIERVPVSVSQGDIARRAWRMYGRGHHPACLNYGDCFAYALAKETGEPLLFKGSDFAQTDIEPALKD
ncbi:MAG: type II toxin-antitoxin system VapC family toxin [Acetobacteraceae bacterium]